MDTINYRLAEERLERSEERTVQQQGWGDTEKARGIAQACGVAVPPVSFAEGHDRRSHVRS